VNGSLVTDATLRDRFAEPGDPDLRLDLDGVTINSVVRADTELWVSGSGGFGFWVSGGRRAEFPPGGDDEVTEFSMRAGFPDSPDDQIDAMYRRLCAWRDRAVPVRVCAAPGRLTTLSGDDGWLPFPFRRPPG
jgi:hypothetical protein